MTRPRPPFLISSHDVPEQDFTYPGDDERLSFGRAMGAAAGLERIGVHLERLPPGRRTSWPHAESDEEEFVYVVAGSVDAWIDGELFPLTTGDFAGFPAGTGVAHTFLNNGSEDALLLVGGERPKASNRIFYPLHPQRRATLKPEQWWNDVPVRARGPHDGRPRS